MSATQTAAQTLDALCADYKRVKAKLSEKERVHREHVIWNAVCDYAKKSGGPKRSQAEWFYRHLGGERTEYEIHVAILRTARRMQSEINDLSITDAIDQAVDAYRGRAAPTNGKAQSSLPQETATVEKTSPQPPPAPAAKPVVTEERVKELERMCEEYRTLCDALSHKDRAQREHDIWQLQMATRGPGPGVRECVDRRREYELRRLLGGTVGDYDVRRQLYTFGKAADPMWDRLQTDLTLGCVRTLSYQAKALAKKQNLTLSEAVLRALADYDEKPTSTTRKRNDGKVVKNQGGSHTRAAVKPDPVDVKAADAAVQFRREVRALSERFVAQRLADADEYLRDKATTDFAQWIEQGVTDLFATIRKHAMNTRREKLVKIGRVRFQQACEILGVKGEFGKKIDLMLVKRRHHERSKQLHPDSAQGDAHRSEFQAVQEARDILEDYMRQIA